METVASVFENVWGVEIGQMGYQAPPLQPYNVYLLDLASQMVYGYTNDDTQVTSTSYSTFIEIDKSFTSSIYSPYAPLVSLDITAAHEFHHAIQFGYNYYFQPWYAEMTSTWMENEVYPDYTQLYTYLPNYIPRTGSVSLDAPGDGSTEYARWIFNRYLAEKFTPNIVKEIWEDLATKPRPADGSDIQMLTVINEVLLSKGSDIGSEIFGFSKKLLTRSWTTHVNYISSIYSTSLDVVVNQPATGSVTPSNPTLAPHAFVYYEYSQASVTDGSFSFDLSTLSPLLSLTSFLQNQDGSMEEFSANIASFAISVPSFPSGSKLFFVLCNPSSTSIASSNLVKPVSGGGGSGCFIATAAYGSYLHPKVAELRHFRDRYLLTNIPGRLFVSFYYSVSPPIARVIAEHEWMRAVVRVLLSPVVFSVEHPLGGIVLIVMVPAVVVRRRRMSRRAQQVVPVSEYSGY